MAENDKDLQWITVNGRHIPIKPGESKKEAISKAFGEDRDSFDADDDSIYKEEMSKAAEETARVNTEQQKEVKGQDAEIKSEEKKPLHIRSLEEQVSYNPNYRKIADSLTNDKDTNEAYFYAFKDAYEKHNYEPSNRDIANELSDRYWSLADSYRDRYGMSDGEWDRHGISDFEESYGTEADFIDKGIEAHNKYFDELDGNEDNQSIIEQKIGDKSGATVNNLNPNNPKYKGFERSHITNAKEVDEGYTYTDANGNKVRESIIEYIPYGALQDGDNRKLYGSVRNYDGSDSPKTGAIVAHSLEDAKDQLEKQVKLGIQGSDRYLGRGKYDEEFFNIIRDNREEGDDEKYKERYGWDFNKPFKEHDFMKDDPYEKWKSEREYGQRLNKILEQHPEYLKKYGSRENILKIMKELDGK